MPVPLIPLIALGLSAGAEIGKAYFQSDEADEKKKMLTTMSKENQLKTLDKLESHYDLMERVLGTQLAQMSTRGVSSDSPSFNAIQRNTFNTGSRIARNAMLEQDISDMNIKTEQSNVDNELEAKLFGDVAETGLTAENFYEKWPKLVAGAQ